MTRNHNNTFMSGAGAFLGVLVALFTLSTGFGDKFWVPRKEFSEFSTMVVARLSSIESKLDMKLLGMANRRRSQYVNQTPGN